MWRIEVRHDGLNRYRMIRGSDQWVVEQRAAALRAQWDDMWSRQQNKFYRQHLLLTGKEEANARTEAAEAALAALQSLLQKVVAKPHELDWWTLKQTTPFAEMAPVEKNKKVVPSPPVALPPVKAMDGLFQRLFPGARKAAEADASKANARNAQNHADDVAAWETERDAVERYNGAVERAHVAAVKEWEARREAHDAAQTAHNAEIHDLATKAARGEMKGVATQVNVALIRADLPEPFGDDFDVEYASSTRSCVVDFILPSPEQMPTLKEVRFVQSRQEQVEKHMSEAERSRMYDDVLYKAALAVLHIVSACDQARFIDRVTLNGWVDYVDRATGLDERSCIMSVAANRSDADRIDFGRVDPKECFRALKGVAASKLVGLAPVAPLQRAMAPDSRFVASEDVVSQIEAGLNVAAMDWKDFEHLVRQVFENEFSTGGAEVRVTQASRDGGVDAIVHDPDPIRGGKIVIQAKRYTNTVDVSAVRDLYGTVMNEGATKGILVTTSQYGPDARKFAQGKPLTLIDGSELLYLLEKMGVKARIDLKEAKATLALQ